MQAVTCSLKFPFKRPYLNIEMQRSATIAGLKRDICKQTATHPDGLIIYDQHATAVLNETSLASVLGTEDNHALSLGMSTNNAIDMCLLRALPCELETGVIVTCGHIYFVAAE